MNGYACGYDMQYDDRLSESIEPLAREKAEIFYGLIAKDEELAQDLTMRTMTGMETLSHLDVFQAIIRAVYYFDVDACDRHGLRYHDIVALKSVYLKYKTSEDILNGLNESLKMTLRFVTEKCVGMGYVAPAESAITERSVQVETRSALEEQFDAIARQIAEEAARDAGRVRKIL